jgi:Spy/CpxP family protein refolding chaperone
VNSNGQQSLSEESLGEIRFHHLSSCFEESMTTVKSSKFVRSLLMLSVTLCSLSLGFPHTPSLAQTTSPTPINPERPNRPNRGKGEWLQQLNLTPEQTRQVQAIRERNQGQMEQARNSLRQARQELNQLMDSNASQRQVQDKFAQVQSLQQQVAKLRFENMMAIREILTPEQRQQMRTLMQERRQRGPGQRGPEQRRQGPQNF